MLFKNQRTIKTEVSCFGVGVHSGVTVNLKFLPAAEDTGIVFRKVDKSGKVLADIAANYNMVSDTRLCTTLTCPVTKHSVSTVEHIMAALWGCSIDNIIVETDSDEMPIMDGSSEHFVFLLECAGVKHQNRGRTIIEVLKRINIEENGAYVSISPSDNFSVSMGIDFNDKVISKQTRDFDLRDSCFKKDICRARTFGFVHEVEMLKKNGLARGGSLDNAIVVAEDGILNEEGLRYKDEFVRHKILDAIGDLYLAGAQMKGHFEGFKSGHGMNNKLLRKFFEDRDAWRIVKMPDSVENNPELVH